MGTAMTNAPITLAITIRNTSLLNEKSILGFESYIFVDLAAVSLWFTNNLRIYPTFRYLGSTACLAIFLILRKSSLLS